jgi:hypothetical protein
MRRHWIIACVVLSGCLLESASTSKKLNDSVEAINKATRWGQLGQAQMLVDPIYRSRFMETHSHWGQLIQLADSEVMQVELAPDKQSAISVISYQWYMNDAMTLHESVVRQRWSRMSDHFALFSETVVQGDPRLLQPKAGPAVMTADGELGLMRTD